MNEVVPPNVPESVDSLADPETCLRVLLDILSTPALTNGEAWAAERLLEHGTRSPRDSYHAAVLAAARWAFQTGQLQIVLPPGLRLVQ